MTDFVLRPLPHPARANCKAAIDQADDGMVVTIAKETRSKWQNRLLWPILDLWEKYQKAMVNGEQIPVAKEAWKIIHLADFRHHHGIPGQFVLTPGGVLVSLGYETRAMPKDEFAEFLTYLLAETHLKKMALPERVDYSKFARSGK